MRKQTLFAVGVAILILFIASIQHARADVYAQFSSIQLIRGVPYAELDSKKDNPIGVSFFGLPPNYFSGTGADDGYYQLKFNNDFTYSYDDIPYTSCWINVNGFITFETPNLDVISTKTPSNLFYSYPNFPKTVVAPYWGDHYYRSSVDVPQGYIPSRVSYYYILDTKHQDSILVIQWKDLNINNAALTSSTGNFQLRLYKSYNQYSLQGDIEFCYGSIGNITGTDVVTKGASVGINGSAQDFNNHSDFLNGLDFNDPLLGNLQSINVARTDYTTLTDEWTPSIYNDNRIRFIALVRQNAPESWGDGDADMSKVIGGKDYNLPPNRYVTMTDVRTILRSVATEIPLDSLLGRSGYHGDVNHNGRYYYQDVVVNGNVVSQKTAITWVDAAFTDNLPNGITNEDQIFFQANEADASMIMDYMAGRTPALPWIYDTTVQTGKITPYEEIANGLKYGNAKMISQGVYQIPVYVNGYINGPISAKFEVSGELTNVNAIDGIMYEYNGKNVVFASTGEFTSSQPIVYLTIKTNNTIAINNARFNDKTDINQSINITNTENGNSNQDELTVTQDPNGNNNLITVMAKQDAYYSLNVIDMQGNIVNTFSTNMNQGVNNFEVNGLSNGMYLVVLNGENVNLSQKMVISK